MWALFLICKVLVVYHDCTRDERVEGAVYRALKNFHVHMEHHTLFDWAASRWFECLIPIFWLYERRPEEWLMDLAYSLRVEGFNYEELYRRWRLSRPERKWTQVSHVVNLAMSLKAGALYSRVTGEDPNAMAKEAYALLRRDHGMACGHFTGDECLSGTSPIQGSECCSVVEAMYSYEHLLSITGDPQWGTWRKLGLQRPARHPEPRHVDPSVRPADQPGVLYPPAGGPCGVPHQFRGVPPLWPGAQFRLLHRQLQPGLAQAGPLHLHALPEGAGLGDLGPLGGVLPNRGARVTCELRTDYPFREALTYVVNHRPAGAVPPVQSASPAP